MKKSLEDRFKNGQRHAPPHIYLKGIPCYMNRMYYIPKKLFDHKSLDYILVLQVKIY